jgi:hypothetical protein
MVDVDDYFDGSSYKNPFKYHAAEETKQSASNEHTIVSGYACLVKPYNLHGWDTTVPEPSSVNACNLCLQYNLIDILRN